MAPDSIIVLFSPQKDESFPELASVQFAYSCGPLASGAALIGEQRNNGVCLI